jgi:hypothetical protein
VKVVSIVVIVLLAGAIGGYLWLTNDPTDPVDVGAVVSEFREAAATTEAATVPTGPEPGVYLYDTTGSESVDALDGSSHRYPATTTMTLRADDRGCIRSRWEALEQRWDEIVRCPGPDGWSHESQIVYHEFFRMSENRGFICEAGSTFLPADLAPGTAFTSTCISGGSDRSGDSDEVVSGRVVGPERVTVGGEPVETVHVRYVINIGGESTGQAIVDRWFSTDVSSLLVREVREGNSTSDTVIGAVHYEERYELTLRSLEPIT